MSNFNLTFHIFPEFFCQTFGCLSKMMIPKLENPWNVESLYEFQYFQCPSCEFKDGKKQDFLNHAYDYHPESIDYLSIITDGSLKDVLCPWDSHENKEEFTGNADHGMEHIKTEDLEGINEDSNQNDHFVVQMVKCYYCEKEMDRNMVRSHMQKSHTSKPVIFNIIKDLNCASKDDNTIEIVKEEPNPVLEYSMGQEYDNYEKIASIAMVKCYYCATALIYSDIKKHIEEEHPGEEVIYVPIDSVKNNDDVGENAVHEGQSDFNCDLCSKSFDNVANLKSHMKVHLSPRKKPRKQSLTSNVRALEKGEQENEEEIQFVIKTKLNEDIESHLKDGEYKCDTCEKIYSSEVRLRSHKRKTHGEKNYRCADCEYRCTSSNHLKRHIMAIHDDLRPKIHKCKSCGKSFHKEKSLNEHIKVFHTNERNYSCDQCGKSFALQKRLAKHIKEVHGGNVYNCDFCSNSYTTQNGLKIHVKRTHEGGDLGMCTQCGKSMEKSNLNRHIRLVHEGQKDHKCDTCGKLYSSAVTLIRHKQSVHEGKKNHTCDTCGNCFSQNASLKRHIRQVHERRKDVKCDKCDKFFYSTVNLKQHNLQAHVKNNSHNCETCGKPYAEISELKRHIERNHSGNQLNCKDCGKTFPHDDALNKHINKCSKIVYDGKCPLCGKYFTQERNMIKHIAAVHEGRKDYKCDLCQKQFSYKDNLRQHIDAVHKGIKIIRSKKSKTISA